jgi:hypothetical protein
MCRRPPLADCRRVSQLPQRESEWA